MNVWDFLDKHWMEALSGGKELSPPVRWAIASSGSLTFFFVYFLITASELLFTIETIVLYLVIGFVFSGWLGVILAWKRERSGPVRLYISGVSLPSFVYLAARSATAFGS